MTKRNFAALVGFLVLAAALLFYWYLKPRDLNAAASSLVDFSWKEVTQITVKVADPQRWFTGPAVSDEDAAWTLHCEAGGQEIEDLATILFPVQYTHKLDDMFRKDREAVAGSQAATVVYYRETGEIMLSVTLIDGNAYLGGLNGFLYGMRADDGSLTGAELQHKLADYVQAHGTPGQLTG